jgi:hypothetical protein
MRQPLFTLLPIAAAAALLVACGGNDTPNNNVPWASPAMIVPGGAASKTIPLSECGSGFQTVTLVVNSSGDMIVSGAPSGTTTISELNRINYDTATNQYVSGQNDSGGPGAYIYLSGASGYTYAYNNSGGGGFYSSKTSAPTHSFGCSLTNGTASFALTTLPSSARLASQMLSGITGITTTAVVSGSFTGGIAYWDNWSSSYTNNPMTTDESIRYFSLNISTGAFGTSPTPNTVGSSYVVTIPTTPTSTYAYFTESSNSGAKSFSAWADNTTTGPVAICIERVGNLLKPYYGTYCD